MARLVLLGGPVGVGKTTVMKHLASRLPRAGLLDADDVRRVSEDTDLRTLGDFAHQNVNAVLRGYIEAGLSLAVVSWVFARRELYEPVIAGLADCVDHVTQLYLVADPRVLAARIAARGTSGTGARDEAALIEFSLSRLELINALPYPRIDTSGLSPEETADEIVRAIERDSV